MELHLSIEHRKQLLTSPFSNYTLTQQKVDANRVEEHFKFPKVNYYWRHHKQSHNIRHIKIGSNKTVSFQGGYYFSVIQPFFHPSRNTQGKSYNLQCWFGWNCQHSACYLQNFHHQTHWLVSCQSQWELSTFRRFPCHYEADSSTLKRDINPQRQYGWTFVIDHVCR